MKLKDFDVNDYKTQFIKGKQSVTLFGDFSKNL
jgi:hypothetical protein